MEKEDIETLPIFTREGVSWNKLNKIFEGKLDTIIHKINEAIAAWEKPLIIYIKFDVDWLLNSQ